MDLKSLNKLGFHTMKVFSHFLASSFYPMFVKFIPFSVPFNEFLQDNFSLWLWFWLLSWIFVLLSWVWHWCEAKNGLSQLGIFWGADFGIILNLGYPVAIIMVTLEDVIIIETEVTVFFRETTCPIDLLNSISLGFLLINHKLERGYP